MFYKKGIEVIKDLFKPKEKYFFRNPILINVISLIDNIGSLLYKKDKKPSFESILISNIGHLGDLILSLRIIEIVREKFPKSKIYFLCNSQAKQLLDGNPYIDEVIEYKPFFINSENFLKKIFSLITVIYKLRKIKPDIVFELRASFPNTVPIVKLGGTKFIAGYPNIGFSFLIDKKIKWKNDQHEIENFLDILRWKIDIPKYPFCGLPDVSYIKNYSEDIKKLIEDMKGKYIVCNIFSRDKKKMISFDKWKEFIYYYKEFYYIVLIGSKKDRVNDLELLIYEKVINLVGKTSLCDLFYVLKNSKFVVTIDSFVGQICSLFNLPSAIIFKGFVNIKRFGPLSEKCMIIKSNTDCFPCNETDAYKTCNAQKCGEINLLNEIKKTKLI
ncbi:MAG: glycosyltransferase family 9 protein [Elusimicrobiales bacterium]|nr:glycosyltransferase family 9 protein [Elusimicrobiales bacterium]